MVEIEIESDPSLEMWLSLQEHGLIRILDDDERELAKTYTDTQRSASAYQLSSSLRTFCCDHMLNLVVKDGLNSIQVINQ